MQYLILFLASVIVSIFCTYLINNLAIKYHWAIRKPRERDIHQKPTPRLGGVALFLSFWIVVLIYYLFSPTSFHFVDEKVLGIDKNLMGVFLGSSVLLLLGIIDDLRGIKPWPKLFFQFLAAFLVVVFGVKIWWFSNPVGGLNIILGNWTYLIVPVWIVLIINVINWWDGLDGLADGISFITLIVLAILSATPLVNQPATALICLILAGACLGFLPFNFNPAKIFLGDSGSMFLGFMIAIAAIISGGKVATVALVLGIPILDAFWVIIRRIISGKSPAKADKFHLHHRFLSIGLSQRRTVLLLYLISASFGIIALQSGTQGKLYASLWLFVMMVIISLGLVIIRMRKYKNM